jgi:glycosyltransferase involved in cell wall biosynthesis
MDNFLALTMMVKDEAITIKKSLDSVKDVIDSVVVYDTGSSDDTPSIISKWCTENNKPLYIKHGEFCDFSTSRNTLLEFAETIDKPPKYLLLLDSNDELRNPENIVSFIKSTNCTGYKLQQCWDTKGNLTKYWNVRLVKNKSGWRYTGRVHEYIQTNVQGKIPEVQENCFIYQDRTDDCEKSGERFKRDVVLLLEDYNSNPTEPRTCFYLAQTYKCLGDTTNASKYYELRTHLGGYYEEVFYSHLQLARISNVWEDVFKWCIKAYEMISRVEPLLIIVEHYLMKRNFHMAYLFINTAYHLEYPKNQGLFIDNNSYEYKRYHLMARIAWYVGQKEIGREACIKAIIAKNRDIDKHNLKFYES